jgi:TatD DNase family protein
MLIETDSPYLAPIPFRGKINEPAWVAKVGEFIANLKGVSVEMLAKQTSNNFYQCFQLDKKFS